jgi:uncharacterized protein
VVIKTPPLSISRKTGNLDPEFMGIIPTRACNSACIYCDFGVETASGSKMSLKLASQITDWYVNLMAELGRDVVEIHFFGGEPMVARDVIEVAVHRARMITAGNRMIPYFEITTNGQYSQKKANWLGDYFDMVVLSFDGFKDVQDVHRPLRSGGSSFKNAFNTAKIISESNAELSIRCCISRMNVGQMPELTRWFCRNFRLSALNFEILCASDQSRKNLLFPPDPVEFAVQFSKSKEIAKDFGVKVIYASDISPRPQVTSCPVGRDVLIVSPDGRISSCYLLPERWRETGLDLDVGLIDPAGNCMIDQGKLLDIRYMIENKPRCLNCFCKWSCAGGCHVGNTFPGCKKEYDDFCIQTRIISALTLLIDLGMTEKARLLQDSPEAIFKLAHQKSDVISDFDKEYNTFLF